MVFKSSSASTVTPAPPPMVPPLDPGFQPIARFTRAYAQQVKAHSKPDDLRIALERDGGNIFRADVTLLPDDAGNTNSTWRRVERHVKFLLWARGGWCLYLQGPDSLCRRIQDQYRPDGQRAFDANLMAQTYDRPFEVRIVGPSDDFPEANESAAVIGGHTHGHRVGFDLGASDYKVAAVSNGEAVFTAEYPWTPSTQSDPAYHVEHIRNAIRTAADHLPRVDAIGGSAAGIYVQNEVRVASLFRAVPPERFERDVRPLFLNLQKEWHVPLTVANDGDVTALAGAMALGRKSLLGIAMGSSEAGGFLDGQGRIRGYLNELAFCPVDVNPDAPLDEWSGDRGVGAQYFSQQAVARLAPRAGIDFDANTPLPERLLAVQQMADAMDLRALHVFDTIGVYLGHALAHYHDEYDYRELLLLGRVTSGHGGQRILETTRAVVRTHYPDVAAIINIHVPDETQRRHGQAVAAASLPRIDSTHSPLA